jgi:hypothetical protein
LQGGWRGIIQPIEPRGTSRRKKNLLLKIVRTSANATMHPKYNNNRIIIIIIFKVL